MLYPTDVPFKARPSDTGSPADGCAVTSREGRDVGIVPARATWTGGFRAVGKTADVTLRLYREVKGYESAGAFAVEIEVVPEEVATEISRRTSVLLWSMGAGAGCDAQYLFANDILGYTDGRIPRHSKVYRDFRA